MEMQTLFRRDRPNEKPGFFGRCIQWLRGGAPDSGEQPYPGGVSPVIIGLRGLLTDEAHSGGKSMATAFIEGFSALDKQQRQDVLLTLANDFGPDQAKLAEACSAYLADPNDHTMQRLAKQVEPPRQELFRRINQAPQGTLALVRFREELLAMMPTHPELKPVDHDMVHLFNSWFNRGFLVMRRIDWSSPAKLLEKIIAYEAVHAIGSWDDLRARLEPADRRCFAFFHPAMPDEPLIFVEIAITAGLEGSIDAILAQDRPILNAQSADTAVFYSISNCQSGLQGVSFGHHLLQQVVEDLSRELPNIKTFVTLSPVPGFIRWLREQASNGNQEAGRVIEQAASGQPLMKGQSDALALRYLIDARDAKGRPVDPVMRFHLGNGARLERLCFGGNPSPAGIAISAGLMVNYRYDLPSMAANREQFLNGNVVLGQPVKELQSNTKQEAHIDPDNNCITISPSR